MALLLGFIVATIIGTVLLLRSSDFHAYVLRTAEFKASDALNTSVGVRDFALQLSGLNPTLDLYDIAINGTASAPLLRVKHARVGVRVISLVRREWYLSDLEIEKPVVTIYVDKNGVTNLPSPKPSEGRSNQDIFELGIRHALISNGEIYYNDGKHSLSADLRDLDLRAGFDPSKKEYSGKLAYRNGHFQLQNFAPMPHELQAEFAATPERFTLRNAALQAGQSRLVLSATLDDYKSPRVRAQYEASVDSGDLRTILRNRTLPAGVVHAKGSLLYATDATRPALDSVVAEGTISSGALAVRTPSFSADVRDFSALYALNDGNLDVRGINAAAMGGHLSGVLSVRDLSGAQQAKLHAVLKSVALEEFRKAAGVPSLQNVSVLGTANAEVEATARSRFKDLALRADMSLNARIASAQRQGVLPVDAVVHAQYSARKEQIMFSDTSIRTQQTTVLLDGTASSRSAMQIRLQTNDLHEFETLANLFSNPKTGEVRQPMALYGRAAFNGWLRGSSRTPQFAGQLNASDIRFKGSQWRLLRAEVQASPSQFSAQNGLLVPADRGRIGFDVRAGLKNWAYSAGSPMTVSLDATQVNLTGLAKAVGMRTPITGTLNAKIRARGTQLNPVGEGRIDLAQARAGGETIQSATVHFNGTGDAVHADVSLQMPAGTAQARGIFYPKQNAYDAQFSANGIKVERLHAVHSRNLRLSGVLNVNATGHGTIDNPQLQATIQVPALQLKDETISNISARADIANHVANINLDSDVVHSHVKGHGTIALTGGYDADIVLDTERIPLEPLVAAYAPDYAGDITGATELHATIRGPLKNQTRVEAHATIPQLTVNYGNQIQIAAPTPIRLDYVNGVLNLQRAALRGTGTDLEFQGAVHVADRSAPMSLLLQGTVDLRLAQLFDPDISCSGQLRFDINSFGQTADPNIQGQVKIVNASISTPDAPLGLQYGNGTLTLTKDRLVISSFEGKMGGGTVVAHGGVFYRPALQFDIALEGHRIRLLYPEGVRSALDANLALSGGLENSRMQGTINIAQLSFTPDFDLTEMLGQLRGTVSPPPSQGFASNLQLQVAVRSTSGINLLHRQLSVQGTANLNVRGTAAEPVVLGRINLSGGDLIFRGNRYVLQGGTVDFTNPVRTQPSLNVSLNTTVQQYNIAMRFEGPVDRLRTSFTSDPTLPPSDIINLLAFGETTEASAANPNPPGSLGAQSALALAASGQVTSRVEKLVGISHLSIDPTLGQPNKSPGATVTIQQRVTGKIFVTFKTDVTSTQNQVIQLQYQQSQRLSFSGTRGQNGGFGADVRIRKEW